MGKSFALLNVIIFTSMTLLGKIVTLPELTKPNSIHLDDQQIYIVEPTSISIYDQVHFKLKKKIGKEGEGPGEFKTLPFLPLFVNITDDFIVVNSFGKVSHFDKRGRLTREEKVKGGYVFYIMPLGQYLVGQAGIQENKNRFRVINIYDKKFNKIKEVCRVIDDFKGPGNGYDILEKRFRHQTLGNLLLVAEKPDFIIDIYNSDGKKLSAITLEYDRIPLTQKNQAEITEYLQNSNRTKTFFPLFKPIRFPSHFPAIMNLYTADKKIYVMTWRRRTQKSEFFIFDKNGKLIRNTFLPLAFQNAIEPSPFAIRHDHFYQLVDNEETDEWELHINQIN